MRVTNQAQLGFVDLCIINNIQP